jgi:hypothetical protein
MLCIWRSLTAGGAWSVRLRILVAVAVSVAPASSARAIAGTLALAPGHRSTEANVAVDPVNPNDILVVARDEDSGPLVGLRTWRSADGGRTFRDGMLVNGRLGGWRADGSDPVAVFDQVGRPAPAFLALRYGRSSWESRIMLGSRTVVAIQHGPPIPTLGSVFGPRVWYDKPWAAIDPSTGVAFVTWTERSETKSGPVEKVAVTSALPGRSFSRPRILGDGSGAQPVIGSGASVVVVWYRQPNLNPRAQILSSRSRDRGKTWSRPTIIASGVNARGDPPFPTVVRAGAGNVACWQQYGTWPHERIACSRSPNGVSWSKSRVVVQPPAAGEAAQPALAASPDGQVWLAFYRFDTHSTSVELWSSTAGADTWRRRGVLMRRAVSRGTRFLGDYEGLAATRDWVIAAFVMPTQPSAIRQVVEVSRFSTHTAEALGRRYSHWLGETRLTEVDQSRSARYDASVQTASPEGYLGQHRLRRLGCNVRPRVGHCQRDQSPVAGQARGAGESEQ